MENTATKPVPGDNQRAKADAPMAHYPHTSKLAAAGVTTGGATRAHSLPHEEVHMARAVGAMFLSI